MSLWSIIKRTDLCCPAPHSLPAPPPPPLHPPFPLLRFFCLPKSQKTERSAETATAARWEQMGACFFVTFLIFYHCETTVNPWWSTTRPLFRLVFSLKAGKTSESNIFWIPPKLPQPVEVPPSPLLFSSFPLHQAAAAPPGWLLINT